MSHIIEMLRAHPKANASRIGELEACINACYDCAQTCTSCADACLAEGDMASLTRCIRLNLDCADICAATGRVLTRITASEPLVARRQLEACVEICRMCAEECERHASMHEHCRICAEACRACERACREVLDRMVAGVGHA